MSEYSISQVSKKDTRVNTQIDELLIAEGIRRDGNLDYTCAMYDSNYDVIATGSCFGNTLRCMAVSSTHQGEGLMNEIVSHLMEVQFERGNSHIFLYTKCTSAKFFASLGFYEIQRIDDQLVFMENKRTGFQDYLKNLSNANCICSEHLSKQRQVILGNLPSNSVPAATENTSIQASSPAIAAIVMNANPFTNGHLYLIEKACRENDLVHLFMVSEDASLVPFQVRKQLIMEGTKQFDNIIYHESGPYIISSTTFPSYFQKDENSVIEGHALLDLSIFVQIAEHLHINKRYVGEEPTSIVTGIYNQIMKDNLPKHGIECMIIPRKESDGKAISASTVRAAIHNQDFTLLKSLVPETTYRYFTSEAATPVIARIQASDDVIHY